ncbi:MCE family protein [Aeromicrobium sp. 50.2.37]|uniref:MCE family protein n=1 Tax=Aeromicrobium sp. 50.2.37 TaxID=2969305 RepID=UPI0021501655|nr:MCE family protein [Aeromicrobium sp. 50.2.37]MCR4514779.1 MCE family protein [Aeromicrobium sp. 50.2.37]
MSDRRTHARRVGMVGVVGLGVLGLLVLALSVIPFGQRTYTAELEHTAGLRVGEEVQVAGVGVGEVTGIRLAKDRVVVTFTADRDVRLGRSTAVAVKVATLLGSHFLEVAPRGTGDLADARIPLARTSVPYNLQDVVDASSDALQTLDAEGLARSMNVMADVLGRTPDETRAAVEGVADLARVASRRSAQLSRLLAASNDVTGTLDRNADAVLDLLEQSTLVLGELTSRREVFDQMLSDAQRMAVQVRGLLDDTEEDLDPMLRDLTTALDGLEDARDDVTQALSSLATMTKYVANASGNGPWLDLHVPVAINDNLACLASPEECS